MAGTADQDLAQVVASAARGDDIAFARIVAAHHDDMRRVCTFVTRDPGMAEDAVQVAWSIAWRKLGSLRDPGHLRAWLMRVAVNETKKLLQTRGRRERTEVVMDAARIPGDPDPVTGIDSLDMLAALGHLDPDDRTLLALRYGLGYDATELSAVTGISPAGTRQRLKRLLDRLRQELE